jgi:hypothetical protein
VRCAGLPVSTCDSALVAGLGALARGGVDFIGVDFIVVGVGGINFYAADEASAIATLDIDILQRVVSPSSISKMTWCCTTSWVAARA